MNKEMMPFDPLLLEEAGEVCKNVFRGHKEHFKTNLNAQVKELCETSCINTLYRDKGYSVPLQLALGQISRIERKTVENYLKDIIAIGKTELSIVQKERIIRRINSDLAEYLDKYGYQIYFVFEDDMLESLNDVPLYHPWIAEGDSMILQFALEAHIKIEYYETWREEYSVNKKRFREKVETLSKQYDKLNEYYLLKSFRELPEHPQDILLEFSNKCWEFFGIKDPIKNNGVQNLIKAISEYELVMPKVSKKMKIEEEERQNFFRHHKKMRENGATEKELNDFIRDSNLLPIKETKEKYRL